MGFAMKNLEYLSNRGHLSNPHSAILDIGSQNLYHATPEAIRSFVEKHGRIENESAFIEEAKRISYFSWPRPGERTSYISELLDLTPFEYTSYDVCPALKTEIFDLNEEQLPAHYREHFDLVLNIGTTEHIINQLNAFRVIHDALKVGGVFFHQLPSIGWSDHGYYCYHESFFIDLAKANDYEIVECWYTLESESSLGDADIREQEKPEAPRSAKYPPNLLTVPSFNINIVLRKQQSKPFSVGLDLVTSHTTISPKVAKLYADGSRIIAAEESDRKENNYWIPLSPRERASTVPGRELLKELGRRIARRIGLTTISSDQNVNPPGKSIVSPAALPAPDTPPAKQTDAGAGDISLPVIANPLPTSLVVSLTTHVAEPGDESLDAMACVIKARSLLEQSSVAEAFGYLNRARAIVHQFPHAMIELCRIAHLYTIAATVARARGEMEQAKGMAVAALEADPNSTLPRELLNAIETSNPGPDTTRHCFVFYDQARANQVHREAVRRCLEFTAISGVIGDVFEFGVLAGWSARIFAESMRDYMIMGNLRLYDSFAGLPEYDSAVDRESYEIAGRNIWTDKMKFPDDFVATLGGNLAQHIKDKLSGVIRSERIQTCPGFYSDSLKNPVRGKAALVHIDCDLYQSTVEVLEALFRDDVFQDGCVLMFDDWNCNKASPYFGERRAFREFLDGQDRYTASEFFTYGFNGAAFILHEKTKP